MLRLTIFTEYIRNIAPFSGRLLKSLKEWFRLNVMILIVAVANKAKKHAPPSPAYVPYWEMKMRNDGGQAFPCEGGACSGLHADPGMSLRQWYAGLALQGILAGGYGDTVPHDDVGGGADAAFFAVQYADALIAELEKPDDRP